MNFEKTKIKNIIFPVCFIILFYWILQNFGIIGKGIQFIFHLFLPFLIGCAIAFILNIPMKNIEKFLFQNVKEESKLYHFKRIICYLITLASVIFVLFLVVVIVIPQLTLTIQTLAARLPEAMGTLQKEIDRLMQRWPDFVKVTGSIDIDWGNITSKALEGLQGGFTKVLDSSFNIIGNVVNVIVNIVVAFIFSIYLLMQKEKLAIQSKKVLYAVLSEKNADKVLYVAELSSKTFSKFFSGQCLEACILGMLFFISMCIFRLPYAALIAVLVAFTALIPVVGAFIGCAIGAFLIVTVAPIKALEFLILFLVLQQIEGNLIYPHVVGNSVGLPSIWVLVAVTVGGNLFGIIGILLFIPLVSVLYALFRAFVHNKLKQKKIPKSKIMFSDSEGTEKIEK
ncbi:MAG: AI-2E family transporter [Lachnospiraceae bacterium]